ncbi:hypothetical protein [Flavobacterium sp.]
MLKRKPYLLLLLGVIVFAVLIFSEKQDTTLDFNVHDTYYVIAHTHLYAMTAIVLLTLFAFYWSADMAGLQLIGILSRLHIYGTLVAVLGMFFPYSWVLPNPDSSLFDNYEIVNICLTVAALLFLLLQILFIINIFVSIVKYLRVLMAKK